MLKRHSVHNTTEQLEKRMRWEYVIFRSDDFDDATSILVSDGIRPDFCQVFVNLISTSIYDRNFVGPLQIFLKTEIQPKITQKFFSTEIRPDFDVDAQWTRFEKTLTRFRHRF